MSGFFEEIKRRKVYRVAVAYVVVAGGVIQLASAVFPAWEMPAWALRLVIVLLLIGFPIALILAWAFDVTPQGIRSTPPADPSRPTCRRRNLILLCFVGLLVSAIAGFFLLPRASARKIDKSIAVLPFENFSDDKDNAFFADGIQDDVLTSLSKVGDLKVISRTSVMAYRGSARNIREIGKTLGVGAILEGSVRKSGNRVRVNVQLINAANDDHIWAEDYDRDLTDVFAIQSDLAHEITTALRAKLSPDEKMVMERKPTQNSEAYLLYLQAHAMESQPDQSFDILKKEEQLLERATQLDPTFALAFAELSLLESFIYHGPDPTAARIEKARAAAAAALRLQSDLPEAHMALGVCYYYGDRDYERALGELAIAERSLPNESRIFLVIGAIERRQGKFPESIAHMTKAASLDPKNANLWEELANTHLALRDFPAAAAAIERGIALAPNSFDLAIKRAALELDWKGDTTSLERTLERIPPAADTDGQIASARAMVKVIQKKYEEAAQLLRQVPQERFECEFGAPAPKEFLLARIYLAAKDAKKARDYFEASRGTIENLVAETPLNWARHGLLGQVCAALGRREDAIREGKRATELLPESVDAVDGPAALIMLAEIYGMLGDADAAIPLLEHSLSSKVGIPVQRLRLDPIWDPLRKDRRFAALLEKYGAKN
jgi:TolB-like protein/predicted Zn-dependent protease